VTQSIVGGPQLPQERRIVTSIPGPRSVALMERKKAVVADTIAPLMPIFVTSAGGGIIQDVDGNSLIDLAAAVAVTTVGNAAPAVVSGVQQQVARFTHASFFITPYENYVEVCENLAELTPGEHAKKSALFTSGAEAVENAVKVARYATGRMAVGVFEHAYHGRTNLTMTMTGKYMPYRHGFGPGASEIYRAPYSYPLRDPEGMTGEEAAARAIDSFERQVGAENLACVVVEPILGEGGFVVPAQGFLPTLREWTAANGIVLVADEIQTGFCRTGSWFACEDEGVVPDIITMAKGIADGLPLSAITGRADLLDAVHPVGLGGTYGGNAVTCAASLGAIDEMRTHGLPARAREIGALMMARLQGIAKEHEVIADVRGRGAMVGIELCEPGSVRPDKARTAALSKHCHAAGVLTLTCGYYGNVIRFLPPLSISDALLHEGFDVLAEAFASTA
jgi:4-aminobutyrate aminotransferase / (S)-3-amino-2-methylpropionate transaminase / 5-aminovalerate transaminase